MEPSTENKTTFKEFIGLLVQYDMRTIRSKNEVNLIRFLSRCDKVHYDFYLSLISKTFLERVPTQEAWDTLDLIPIDIHELYGCLDELVTDFAELTYPILVTRMGLEKYQLCVRSKEAEKTFSYYQHKNKFIKVKNLLPVDDSYINTQRFTLVGFGNISPLIISTRKTVKVMKIFPIDYFSTRREYLKYLKNSRGSTHTDFVERVGKLDKFLAANYTRQIQHAEHQLVYNVEELEKVLYAMSGSHSDNCTIVLSDKDTARTGQAFYVPVVNTFGIIDEIWMDIDTPKGFEVWFNGELLKLPYDFTGKNTTLLNHRNYVNGKVIELTHIRLGKTIIHKPGEILWDKPKWRLNRHKGYIHVEKCALCGGVESPHRRQGICKACEFNIRTYYANYGVDTWIKQTKHQRAKRLNTGWHYLMPERLGLVFRDSYIVARENGDWMFRWDEERAEGYRRYLAGEVNNKGVEIDSKSD